MSKLIAKHEGGRAQIIRVKGGETVTIKPGQSLPVEPATKLTSEIVRHYAERGVTFSDPANDRGSKPTAAEKKAAQEKAAEIAAAEKDVADAKALVDAAANDGAKTEATALLAAAEAKLEALKA